MGQTLARKKAGDDRAAPAEKGTVQKKGGEDRAGKVR